MLYRVKNLEKAGIIRGYLTEMDTYRLGLQFYPLLIKFQDMPMEEEEGIYEYVKKCKSSGWAVKCEGAWDMNLVLRVRNAKEVAEFFDEFDGRFGNYIYEKAFMHTVSLNYFKRNSS